VNTRGKKLFNGIATESRENMRQYFFAVLEDNDKEQRIKGFAESDLIEIYEQSTEAIKQKDLVRKIICLFSSDTETSSIR